MLAFGSRVQRTWILRSWLLLGPKWLRVLCAPVLASPFLVAPSLGLSVDRFRTVAPPPEEAKSLLQFGDKDLATLRRLNPELAVGLERVMKKGKELSGSIVKQGGQTR